MVQSSASNFTVGLNLFLVNMLAMCMSLVLPDMTGKDLDELRSGDTTSSNMKGDTVGAGGNDRLSVPSGNSNASIGGEHKDLSNNDHLFLFNGVPKRALQKLFGKTLVHD